MPGRRATTSSVSSDPSVETARAAAACSELDLLHCLHYAPQGVLVIDAKARVVAFNHTAEALWNRPRAQVLGHPLGELVDAENRADFLASCLHHDGSGSYELTLRDPDGRARWLAVSAARVPENTSQLQVLFVRDISAERARDARMRLLSLALDSSDNAIVVCDPELNILYVNAGFSQVFGYAESEVLGHLPSNVLTGPGTDLQTVQQTRERVRAGFGHQADILAYRKDGTPLWATLVATPIAGENGDQRRYILSFTDITQSKMHEVLHKNVLEALVREQPLVEVATLICNEVERIAPELMAAIVSVDGSGCLQPLAAPSMPARFGETMSNMRAGPRAGALGTSIWRGKQVLVLDPRTDPLFADYMGLVQYVQLGTCVATPIKSSSGRVLGSFALCYRQVREPLAWHLRLIELCVHLCALALEREQTRARVHQLAFYDSLTGLPNRVMFSARAEQALAAAEHQGAPVAILFVDIDRFKRVNETQGHAAGDGLLRDIAHRIGDTLGVTDLIGRQAGDEFVLMLPNCSVEQAAGVAERLLLALAEPLVVGQVTLHPSASIGVAMFPEDGGDIETLLRHADLAMFRAKREGGNSVCYFSSDMNRMAQERVAMETALRDALHRNKLQLHYQPQLHSQAPHALYGVEALLRWEHPNLGAISPARFVPMAEECGLIDELGHWVLRETCRQMADWRQRGIPVPRVAVNLSANNFADPQLPARVEDLLATAGLQPADLALEMTESVMLSNPGAVLANLRQLQASGVLLSLDDFGTGYSSLSHLHQLPVNELKLDMSFVSDLEHCQTSRALTTSVLRIGETLGLHTVAEGVETEAQRAFLARLGCRVLQGFLFAPALTPAALEHWLQGRAPAQPT
ncbi:sensor domain-containing protein [Xanthomonas rydalmerensis]|uniref:EAL domain-containing protein n=1 Tax=Xanthomonas rydalmerensis TaxID=3046274 RepID=A0ABZ0JIH1_9XANT|nr:EAL domain-containing protein [Xanthomonas sp. DM-2023]WOS39007.1 EAL domain-containing protein [Xanthomonas sp. DM-2023]WOS43189.1 EAL domain-containing protein [Xanthomonas sp. DM-2023]WOS47369.1 EAL domain-containing protein [Xanthomonas sp. DM-2023]WOS51550.1 EAL domain-containing protein [Xanthomonas sp. DM-2023]WOS55732.1 EAL domain-containing protein [Xanthomonas sp. DM-2023]